MSRPTEWESVLGLEVHVQLATNSKIFAASATAYGAPANTQACEVSLALPGVLPVMNIEAARLAVRFGLAVNADINARSVFARKNYFYPDLPKGYQISQFEHPIIGRAQLAIDVDGQQKIIGITRAHLEEDAGKSLHEDHHGLSGIDLNRAGVPLLEIVSEPDLRSAAEAVAYLRTLHTLVRYLDISDGNMQEGSFRCDANVSIRRKGTSKLGTRTELKNINSFKFVEKAIEFEIQRQIDVLEGGGEVVQETRLYDVDKDATRSMRGKEEAYDYRYFPDPDLPPLQLDAEFIAEVRATLPELPTARRARLITQYGLSDAVAHKLTADKTTAEYFEATCAAAGMAGDAPPRLPQDAANWILGELSAALNTDNLPITASKVSAKQLAVLLQRLADGSISGKIAKQVFAAVWQGQGEVDQVIEAQGLKQISDHGQLEAIIDQILADSSAQIAQYKSGQQKVFGYFVGQVMQRTQGKANPKQVNDILHKKLD